MTGRDFYQVLGIARDATSADIRTAYARLVRRHHPDVVGELPSRLNEVQQAYRCLSDMESRARHDRAIAEHQRQHLEHQRRVQKRLERYDRRHPSARSRPRRRLRWPSLLMAAAGLAVIARLSVDLIG